MDGTVAVVDVDGAVKSYNPNLHMIWWDNIKFQTFYVDHLSPSNGIMTLAIGILLLD